MMIRLDTIDLPERDLRAHVDQDALDELADSMRSNGQIQACVVFLKPDGRYEIIAGARRWRAAHINEWTELRCEVGDSPNDERRAAVKLIENIQREDLTPVEEAYGLLQLIEGNDRDIRWLQRQTGKSRAWVKSRLEILEIPDDCQQAIQAGLVSMGVGKVLGSIANTDVRLQYLKYAANNGLSIEAAEAWANQAEFAEAGVLAMQDHERRQQLDADRPQLIEQQFTCFGCKESKPAGRVNYFVLCGPCSDTVVDGRPASGARPQPPVLDTYARIDDNSRALQD